MNEQREIPDKDVLERIAGESGLAMVVVDRSGAELSAANNNSICRTLNPDGKLTGQCAAFCGTALEESTEVGSSVTYTCHAGLKCRASAMMLDSKPAAVIVGRSFVTAENYRRATERAISGDWSKYSATDLFENILLTSSAAVVDKTMEQVESLAPKLETTEPAEPEPAAETMPEQIEIVKAEAPTPEPPPVEERPESSPDKINHVADRFTREIIGVSEDPQTDPRPELKPEHTPGPISKPETLPPAKRSERRTAEARAWRSFFGSLLKNDYSKASDSILEFLAHQYGFTALIWLERQDDRFENTATFGEMKNRRVRLGIAPDDFRLIEASHNDVPLELGERAKGEHESTRTMCMFPIGVGDEITAAIAVLDPIDDPLVKKQIARIAHSIAPQLEILRLRGAVAHGETLATAVRRFSESLKRIDNDDLWFNLTQNAAEMLRAERASLLIYNDKEDMLEIKAIIGAKNPLAEGDDVGNRVARIVFSKDEPVVITDVSKTGLPPAPADRGYKTTSFLSSPISVGGRKIGVMNFADKASGQAFDTASLEMFQAIAPQLAVAVDRASLKEKAGEFEQLSVTDALTGLLNRRYIEERLMEEVKRSNRHGYPMSFMMLDVDEFKSYNDTFGHPAGDEALKLVAHVIRETLRGADVAARFGGEEFSILLPQTTGEEAIHIAERIRHNIEYSKFSHRRVTVSIGVASCSAELCASAALVDAADKALYAAKGKGRNKVVAFEELDLG